MEPTNPKLELSLQEKERRWSLIREMMQQEELSAIVVYADSHRWMPFSYLTNVMGDGLVFPAALIFPADGNPITINSRSRDVFFSKKTSWIAEENIYYSHNWIAELVNQLTRLKLHVKHIGVDSLQFWPVRGFDIVRESCPDIRWVEVSRLLGKLRARKSKEELRLIEDAIHIGELAQNTFLANLKPGKKEQEVVAKVEDVVRASGVDRRYWLMSSNPDIPYPYFPGETIIRKPNPVVFSSEFVRLRGYACQVIRTYCWEKPKGEYKRMWELWQELRLMVVREFRPGRDINQLREILVGLINEWGFEADYLGHAIGMNMGDLPPIDSEPGVGKYMEWTIVPDEIYVVHPMIRMKGGGPPLAWVGDMYLIGEDTTKCLTPFLSGLPEIIPG